MSAVNLLLMVLAAAIFVAAAACAKLYALEPGWWRLGGTLALYSAGNLVVLRVLREVGLALAMVVTLIFQAVSAAGTTIDYMSGLTSSQLFDPLSGSAEGPMARLYQLLCTVTLFVTGGHLLLIAGLVRSFDAAPVGGLNLGRLGDILSSGVGNFMLAALQIGAPLLGALFVTELLLALASRAAPQLNILVIGFGAKGLVLITLSTLAIPVAVAAVPRLTDAALGGMWQLVR